jgi:hypothetical protein
MPGISFRVPKEEPPSPPRRQPKKPKSAAGARVKVEPGTVNVEPGTVKPETTSPEPSKAWRMKYAVPPVYHSEEDGKWAGWQAATRLSAKEAGVIVIESDINDDDDNDGEASGEDGEEDDAALNFGAFDYWRC